MESSKIYMNYKLRHQHNLPQSALKLLGFDLFTTKDTKGTEKRLTTKYTEKSRK